MQVEAQLICPVVLSGLHRLFDKGKSAAVARIVVAICAAVVEHLQVLDDESRIDGDEALGQSGETLVVARFGAHCIVVYVVFAAAAEFYESVSVHRLVRGSLPGGSARPGLLLRRDIGAPKCRDGEYR